MRYLYLRFVAPKEMRGNEWKHTVTLLYREKDQLMARGHACNMKWNPERVTRGMYRMRGLEIGWLRKYLRRGA